MSEWGVIGVIVTLVGLLAAIIKPLVSLTRAITELSAAVGHLQKESCRLESRAHESHRKLWEHNDEQDAKIESNARVLLEHDGRIKMLEGDMK